MGFDKKETGGRALDGRVPVPAVGPNDVKIKIHKTAICGTDVHIYQWNDWAQHTIPIGLTAGHEYVGEIVETGGRNRTSGGDLVSGKAISPVANVGTVWKAIGKLPGCKGVGVNRNRSVAEYLVIPSSNVWPCNPNIPEELYSIFDPFGNATHTALSYDLLGEDVLIAGAGLSVSWLRPLQILRGAPCGRDGFKRLPAGSGQEAGGYENRPA